MKKKTEIALKPLNWTQAAASRLFSEQSDLWNAEQRLVGLKYAVVQWKRGDFRYLLPNSGKWELCDSIEHGKQLCWEHYQGRVAELFQDVEVK